MSAATSPTHPIAPKPSAPRSARTRAREFVVQALYQHLVGQNTVGDIDVHTRNLQGFSKADSLHYDAVFRGCVEHWETLDAHILPLIDRPLAEISPCERAILWMGVYELMHCVDVPWRVVLNEHIELGKSFGGTDGHKYINGVLHPLIATLRSTEWQAEKAKS